MRWVGESTHYSAAFMYLMCVSVREKVATLTEECTDPCFFFVFFTKVNTIHEEQNSQMLLPQ